MNTVPIVCLIGGSVVTLGLGAPNMIFAKLTFIQLSSLSRSQLDRRMLCAPIVCTPSGDKISLLYGLQQQAEAYLLPVSRFVRAQVSIDRSIDQLFSQSIIQSINQSGSQSVSQSINVLELDLLQNVCAKLFRSFFGWRVGNISSLRHPQALVRCWKSQCRGGLLQLWGA